MCWLFPRPPVVEAESLTSAMLVQEGKTAIERYSTFREFGVCFGQTPILCSLLVRIAEPQLAKFFSLDLRQAHPFIHGAMNLVAGQELMLHQSIQIHI
jgi:hypothetical protein